MKITDIIEYTPERRELLNSAIKLGIDTEHIIDVDMSDMIAKRIIDLLKFGITNIPLEEIEQYGKYEWFDKYYQILMNKEKYFLQSKEKQHDITQKLGYEPDWAVPLLETIEFGIKTHNLDEYIYLKEVGMNELLIDYNQPDYEMKNNIICTLHYLECEELEKILTHPNQNSLLYDISHHEYTHSGRVDISLDERYSLKQRDRLLATYIETVIDLRLIPDVDIDNVILTSQEQTIYRELSNTFRQERKSVDLTR